MNRPIFLRGMRRVAVSLDVNAFEAVILVLFAAIIVLTLTYQAWAAPVTADCLPPDDTQVLVWTWRDDGAASCQYIPRSPR